MPDFWIMVLLIGIALIGCACSMGDWLVTLYPPKKKTDEGK